MIPTQKQLEANVLLQGKAQHVMLFGGSRSGKTFWIVRVIVWRALSSPQSRHCILRFVLGHIKQSIVLDTFPKVMNLCFPGIKYDLNKSDLYASFPNGSEIWFGGLDEKDRVEKILGNEYATIYLNECSQIPWGSRNVALTRLAQLVTQKVKGRDPITLPLKMYYDENPPDKGHWTYKLFRLGIDPESRQPLPDPENYASLQLNPGDNQANLGEEYLRTLSSLPARLQKRFLQGEFGDLAPNALFRDETLDKWRVNNPPQMIKIVVAIDPSGSEDDDTDHDEIGIMVCGLGTDGNAYVLEDLTCKAGPSTWGRIATQAFDRWQANTIVAEINFGGAMVRNVILSSRPNTPFRPVTASRGKSVRAEPVSALMEDGKVRLAGVFRGLEDELVGFTTHGYTGDRSPNRADAMIWGISDLFPQLYGTQKPKPVIGPQLARIARNDALGWMGN